MKEMFTNPKQLTFCKNWTTYIYQLQDQICSVLEKADGKAHFIEDKWLKEPDGKAGGGKTRVIANGDVFEKGGVNTSEVFGEINASNDAGLKTASFVRKGDLVCLRPEPHYSSQKSICSNCSCQLALL